jgi:hypothetical protein
MAGHVFRLWIWWVWILMLEIPRRYVAEHMVEEVLAIVEFPPQKE